MTVRIPWAKPEFGHKEKEHLVSALESTWISGGRFVEEFEASFTRLHGVPHGVSTSNGTTALHLAMLGLGLGPGDEVIVPGFTFVAPGNMVIATGATPVFVDIDPDTWCISPQAVEACIGPKTKAIVAVHVYGNVCDMDALDALAKRHDLALIEDVAEAAFSRLFGRAAGTFGSAGCFSFQATKTITMGEGGLVLTQDPALFERMRIIRDHGMRKDKRYWHDVVGFDFRLTNLQAAVGCAQLERLDDTLARRRAVYAAYRRRLLGRPGITLQVFRDAVDPVVWAVALAIDPASFSCDRDGLIKALLEAGIETRPGFYPFSVLPPYRSKPLPIAERVAATVLSLPSFPGLTEEQIDDVCSHLDRLRR